MSEQVQLNVWLNKYKRNRFTAIYKTLQDKYSKAMMTLFSDIEGAANEYKEVLTEKYGTMYNYEVVDPGDVYEEIELEAYEYYKSEKLMEYNFHFSLLATMYQIFEQQLRSFIYEEINHSSSPVKTEEAFSEFGTNMGKIKEYYNHLDYDLTSTPHWGKVETLIDIVNTYKHGDGRSAKRLYKNKPELFLKAYFGEERMMDQELTTNFEIVFDIKKIDFDSYANVLIEFWMDFPEHLTSIYTFDNRSVN